MSSENDLNRWRDPEIVRRVINRAHTVAVVGASPNPARPSHEVAAYLRRSGLRVIPVNPTLDTLQKCAQALGKAISLRLADRVDVPAPPAPAASNLLQAEPPASDP